MLKWFRRRTNKNKSYKSNKDWINGLQSPPEDRAVKQLRATLVRGLKPALSKFVDHDLHQFVEDTVQDALLKILDNIESFRGDSKFTTWAMKIAVREGFTELRRKKYDDISIEDLVPGGQSKDTFTLFADARPAPDYLTHQRMVMEKTMAIINNELTDKQKTVITALMIHDLPIGIVAEQMGTNRNALYKLVHDTRKKLKNRLEVEGINPDGILNDI